MDESQKNYLDKLKTHSEYALKSIDYSIQRIDLLIISVSGAGIYVCLQILQYANTNHIQVPVTLKVTGLLFVISIIINFISQWASYKAHLYGYKSTQNIIYDIENKTDSSKEKSANDCKSVIYNTINNISNILSTIAMLSGLIVMIIFIWVIF